MCRSEAVLDRKLEDARTVRVADGLMRADVWVRHQVAQLIERHAIATLRSDGIVLDLVDSYPIPDKEIGAIEQVEGLRLHSEGVPLAEVDAPRDSQIHFDIPRAMKGVKSCAWAGPTSPDS